MTSSMKAGMTGGAANGILRGQTPALARLNLALDARAREGGDRGGRGGKHSLSGLRCTVSARGMAKGDVDQFRPSRGARLRIGPGASGDFHMRCG